MARPKIYASSLQYNKNKDPDRRKMREIVSLKGWTKEEKEERRRKIAAEKSKEEQEKQKRLKPLRESVVTIKSKQEYIEFRARINKQNRERLDEILNDKEKMWEIFGDRLDYTYNEIREMRAERRNDGEWVSEKDIERATQIIYGGMKGEVFEEENETDYENPYGEIPED